MDIAATIKEIIEDYLPNVRTLNITICETYSPTIIPTNVEGDVHRMIKTDGNDVGKNLSFHAAEGVAKATDISVSNNRVGENMDIQIGDFVAGSDEAIKIIKQAFDVDKELRNALISLINEANAVVQNQDSAAQASCKVKFKYLVMGAGKALDKLLSLLSKVAPIASFFGLTVK